MTDLSAEYKALAEYRPKHKVRFVTAASLFDGHDAAINIMRRILQSMGAEVVHLGHNRSVDEVVTAALQEDVQGIAISSYQGGHVEYFKYMVDLLRQRGGEHIQVFGGGGGCRFAWRIAFLFYFIDTVSEPTRCPRRTRRCLATARPTRPSSANASSKTLTTSSPSKNTSHSFWPTLPVRALCFGPFHVFWLVSL